MTGPSNTGSTSPVRPDPVDMSPEDRRLIATVRAVLDDVEQGVRSRVRPGNGSREAALRVVDRVRRQYGVFG